VKDRPPAGVEPPRVPDRRPGPRGGRRDLNRRHRVEQICAAALPLLLEQGVGAVTIDQIVERAGIAKGSFYRYFDDKRQLVETLFEPLTSGVRTALDECDRALDALDDPSGLPAVYMQLAIRMGSLLGPRTDLLRLYLQENRSPGVGARAPIRALADEISTRAVALSAKGRALGLLDDSDPRVGALTVIGAAERLSFAFLSGEDVGAPGKVPAALVSMILDGVRRRAR